MRERNATDWSRIAPSGELSPLDDRALTAGVAGFPYGEELGASALAAVPVRETPVPGGVTTSSPGTIQTEAATEASSATTL